MITVVHPNDRTTTVLKGLYEGQNVRLLDERMTNAEIRHGLHRADPFEPLMLLGHGSDRGLFSRIDDTQENFDRILVGKHHLYYLHRLHRIIGIWCHADIFARQYHLCGLFTGMFISEMPEAEEYGVNTSPEELQIELQKFVLRLRTLLNAGVAYHEIPQRLQALDDVHSALTKFNYERIYFIS